MGMMNPPYHHADELAEERAEGRAEGRVEGRVETAASQLPPLPGLVAGPGHRAGVPSLKQHSDAVLAKHQAAARPHMSPQPYQYPGFQLFSPPQPPPPLRQFGSTPSSRLSPNSSAGVLSPASVLSPGSFAASSQLYKLAEPVPRGGAAGAPRLASRITSGLTAAAAATATAGAAPGAVGPAPVHSYDVRGSIISYDHNGNITKPRVTTTMWEDEKTLCYQVEANGISVVRRADNDMINGTKLLNVARITRGRRDGILKAERIRHVVKIGSMHLKGVWIPFERAHAMAQREKIVEHLYPLFVKDIQSVLRETGGEELKGESSSSSSPPAPPAPPPQPQAPAPPPLHTDPCSRYRSASTILPQPFGGCVGGSVRTTPPFGAPLGSPYRPLPGTNPFDYARPVSVPPLVPAPQPRVQQTSQLLRPGSAGRSVSEGESPRGGGD